MKRIGQKYSETFVPIGAEVKEVSSYREPVKGTTAPKQEEIEQPIKKSGRQKSMARKRKLGQSTAKEDEEYEKEKEELSSVFIIALMSNEIGLDGIQMLHPSTSRTLRVYPLDTVTRCEVYDSSTLAFWSKSSVDIEPSPDMPEDH
ncbi:hypothetical protein Tco_1262574 [Tanacetum coccineum]